MGIYLTIKSDVLSINEEWDHLASQIMIISSFRNSERQTMNLILSLVGIQTKEDADDFLLHIFDLIRQNVLYVPEAQLSWFIEKPESVDVYLTQDFYQIMRSLIQKLEQLHLSIERANSQEKIPKKVLIDLQNIAQGKYVGTTRKSLLLGKSRK